HDPTRTARFVKTHPYLYFADYDWAIWVDANLLLVEKPEALLPDHGSASKFLTWHHPLRNCVYQEGEECIKRGKDDADIISQHMEGLRSQNYPAEAGMFETSVVVSKMGYPEVETMFKQWWADIARWSRRDQLSLPVVLNGLDLDVGYLARTGICMRTDPRFVYFGHNK
ncbi:MAG: glycosyltransferase domain-containing protein, partial [Pseudomonadota bacterium]